MTCQRCKKPMPTSRWKTCEPCRLERKQWSARRKAGQHTGRRCSYCDAPMGERRQVQCGAPDCEENWRQDKHLAALDRQRLNYATDPAYRATVLARNERWRVENRETWLAYNKGYYLRTYRQRAAVFKAAATRRRALKRDATVIPFTPAQLAARLAVYGRCWICGTLAWDTVDHVKPLSKGGPHMLANLRPACAPCNRAKAASWPYVPPQKG